MYHKCAKFVQTMVQTGCNKCHENYWFWKRTKIRTMPLSKISIFFLIQPFHTLRNLYLEWSTPIKLSTVSSLIVIMPARHVAVTIGENNCSAPPPPPGGRPKDTISWSSCWARIWKRKIFRHYFKVTINS